MNGEKYVLACPHCGDVEGFVEESSQREEDFGNVEEEIVADAFETEGQPVSKIRCPVCGRWLSPDHAKPAE